MAFFFQTVYGLGFISVYGFGQTGLNIRLNGSIDSVWTPYSQILPILRLTFGNPSQHIITYNTELKVALLYVSWVGINLDDNTFCRAAL